LDFPLAFPRRRRVGIDRFPQPEPARLYAPLNIKGLGLGFDRLFFDSHLRLHILLTLLGRSLHATGPYLPAGVQNRARFGIKIPNV
jgi:hypothetical protein